MLVNDWKDAFTVFLSLHDHELVDGLLMTVWEDEVRHQHENPATHIIYVIDYEDIDPTEIPPFLKGDTVRAIISGGMNVCIVTDSFKTGSGLRRYKVRKLNTKDRIVLITDDVEDIRPDPADIPIDYTSVYTQAFTEILLTEDLKRL